MDPTLIMQLMNAGGVPLDAMNAMPPGLVMSMMGQGQPGGTWHQNWASDFVNSYQNPDLAGLNEQVSLMQGNPIPPLQMPEWSNGPPLGGALENGVGGSAYDQALMTAQAQHQAASDEYSLGLADLIGQRDEAMLPPEWGGTFEQLGGLLNQIFGPQYVKSPGAYKPGGATQTPTRPTMGGSGSSGYTGQSPLPGGGSTPPSGNWGTPQHMTNWLGLPGWQGTGFEPENPARRSRRSGDRVRASQSGT